MTKLELETTDDLVSSLNKIRDLNDEGIQLVVPEGSILFDSSLNLKLLNKQAEKLGKVLHIETIDKTGLTLLSEEDGEHSYQETHPGREQLRKKFNGIPKLSLPSVSLPQFNFFENLGTKTPLIIFVGIVTLLVGGGIYAAAKSPHAEVKIILNSQPLTKSVQIKVVKDTSTNAQTKTLRGIELKAEATEQGSIETTGEKLVGEKAKGKVTIFNFTAEEKTFKEGTKLTYKDLEYVLDEKVTVPAQTIDTTDPLDPKTVKGQEEADVVAADIGDKYNLEKGKNLKIKDYKEAEFIASVTEEIDGGESKTVKVVSKDDISKVSADTLAASKEAAENALNAKIGLGQKLVKGAVTTSVVKEEFSTKEGEEAEKIEVTQTISASGMAYAVSELDSLLDSLSTDLIPEGFEISDKSRDIQVDVLGNSDTTVLSSSEADLQVTLKTYVIPILDEEQLKEDLGGKTGSEAEKVLGSIRNVKTYELTVSPNIPLFNKVPKDPERIVTTIEINE
jgi:hypothetical protein